MKNYFIILVILSTVMLPWELFGAPSQITPAEFRRLKRINRSLENPVDLMISGKASAAGDHGGHLFTLKTLVKLGPEPLSDFDKKQIRNEICASTEILRTNVAIASSITPGSLGAFVYDQSVVILHDNVLAGERLDSVLNKLSAEKKDIKLAAIKYYAVAMAKQLELIHNANVIWNNAELRNFYVSPEGFVKAVDFSEATKPVTPQAAKDLEFKKFFVNTLYAMFHTLFPVSDEANLEFSQIIAALIPRNIGAVALAAENWRELNWDQAAVITAIADIVGNTGAFNTDWNNAIAFIQDPDSIPYRSLANVFDHRELNLSKNELLGTSYHPTAVATPASAGTFNAHDDVIARFTIAGAPGRLYPQQAGFNQHAHGLLCNGWTGE